MLVWETLQSCRFHYNHHPWIHLWGKKSSHKIYFSKHCFKKIMQTAVRGTTWLKMTHMRTKISTSLHVNFPKQDYSLFYWNAEGLMWHTSYIVDAKTHWNASALLDRLSGKYTGAVFGNRRTEWVRTRDLIVFKSARLKYWERPTTKISSLSSMKFQNEQKSLPETT